MGTLHVDGMKRILFSALWKKEKRIDAVWVKQDSFSR
jgi:hypothetical protein